MKKIRETEFYSFVKGNIPKGCRYCIKGEKIVLFITGLCSLKCFYCPVSDKKIYKDVIYANEWKINKIQDLFDEARLTEAKGAGITGGDPLIMTDRTCKYIKLLKKRFGKKFHIHLYTPLNLVNESKLKKLFNAGLDEIRFHPDLDNKSLWNRISLANKYSWDVGIEIPCIPGKKKEILDLIEFVKDKVKFVNLNELELSERNFSEFKKRGLKCKSSLSYAIKGSQELAMKVMKQCNESITIYFCTAKLKDCVQMRNRIMRRARNIRKKFDIITKQGTIIHGAIYLPELTPGFDYRKKLEKIKNKNNYIMQLDRLKNKIIKIFNINADLIYVDKDKLRIVCDSKLISKISDDIKKLNLVPAIVEEYPTKDAIEVDVDFV